MLKMKIFWLIFRGKFEQKTQKSIFLKNQWKLKNIKKAIVVKNIIAEEMPFTKSIFEQFWRSYCKKTIFVVFHFLKFLPSSLLSVSFDWQDSVRHAIADRRCPNIRGVQGQTNVGHQATVWWQYMSMVVLFNTVDVLFEACWCLWEAERPFRQKQKQVLQ